MVNPLRGSVLRIPFRRLRIDVSLIENSLVEMIAQRFWKHSTYSDDQRKLWKILVL